MSANATIVFQNDKFIIGQENEWFFIYENYMNKIVLVFETANEQEAVNYIMDHSDKWIM